MRNEPLDEVLGEDHGLIYFKKPWFLGRIVGFLLTRKSMPSSLLHSPSISFPMALRDSEDWESRSSSTSIFKLFPWAGLHANLEIFLFVLALPASVAIGCCFLFFPVKFVLDYHVLPLFISFVYY